MMPSRTRSAPTTGIRGELGRTLLTAFLLLAIVSLSLAGYFAFSQMMATAPNTRGTTQYRAQIQELMTHG